MKLSEKNLRQIIKSLDWVQVYPEIDEDRNYYLNKEHHIDVECEDFECVINAHIEYLEDLERTSASLDMITPPSTEVLSTGKYASINYVHIEGEKYYLDKEQIRRLENAIEEKLTY